MPSYLELKAELATLELKMEVALAKEKAEVIREIQAKMDEWQIPLRDLAAGRAAHRRAPAKPSQIAPKYRDPESGATWSGRGRAPGWIADKDRTRFEIG